MWTGVTQVGAAFRGFWEGPRSSLSLPVSPLAAGPYLKPLAAPSVLRVLVEAREPERQSGPPRVVVKSPRSPKQASGEVAEPCANGSQTIVDLELPEGTVHTQSPRPHPGSFPTERELQGGEDFVV